MYILSKLELIYLVKIKLEVKASVLLRKENKREKGVTWRETKLGSLFRATNCLAIFPKLEIDSFKDPMSIKILKSMTMVYKSSEILFLLSIGFKMEPTK